MSHDDIRQTGHCYCGAVQFAVHIPAGQRPFFSAYCHCDSCRRAHAAPLYQVVCVDAHMLSITAGAEHIRAYQKRPRVPCRDFCGICGTRVRNRFPGWRPGGRELVAFFPNLFEEGAMRALPDGLRVQRNNAHDECVLDWAFVDGMRA